MTDSSARRRFPIWATVVIYLVVLVTAITASGYLFYLGVYGTNEGCFDAVTEIAEEIQVAEAGTVGSMKTFDGGGLRNCEDPTMSVLLSGVNAATNVERNLTGAGFSEDSPWVMVTAWSPDRGPWMVGNHGGYDQGS